MDWVETYRPHYFKDMYPTTTVSALQTHVARNDRSHAFLFAGGPGTGKTSLARILARFVLCPGPDQEPQPPDHCQDLLSVAVREMNMADLNRIESIRDLVSEISLPSILSDHRVYILDEPQRIKRETQDLLLKVLEEARHYTIILCTTAPDQLIRPLVQRCVAYWFTPLTQQDSASLIKHTLEAEGYPIGPAPFTKDVLRTVLHAAQGCPRLVLRLLQQVATGGPVHVGDTAPDAITDIIRAIEQRRWPSVVRLLQTVHDYDTFRRATTDLLTTRMERDPSPVVARMLAMFATPIDPSDAKAQILVRCYQLMEAP